MSDKYTPTTRKVRDDYITRWGYAPVAGAEFDRWLAQHDAHVAAFELRRVAEILCEPRVLTYDEEDGVLVSQDSRRFGGQHITSWLDERADRLDRIADSL